MCNRSEGGHAGEWLVLALPILYSLALLPGTSDVRSQLQRWCKQLMDASPLRSLDDYQILFIRWLLIVVPGNEHELSPLFLCTVDAEITARPAVRPDLRCSGSTLFKRTLESIWRWFLTDVGEPCEGNLRSFPTPAELQSWYQKIEADYEKSNKNAKEKLRRTLKLWDFGFLVTHLYFCRTNYGSIPLQIEEGDRELMEILIVLGQENKLNGVPDLIAEIVFCVGLFCNSSRESSEFIDQFLRLGNVLLQLQEEDGSLPLEPSLEERAFLHGQFVFCQAMLMLSVVRTRSPAEHPLRT